MKKTEGNKGKREGGCKQQNSGKCNECICLFQGGERQKMSIRKEEDAAGRKE